MRCACVHFGVLLCSARKRRVFFGRANSHGGDVATSTKWRRRNLSPAAVRREFYTTGD